MFLTFLARMLPALSVAKPACIRKISAPARRGREVRSAPFVFAVGEGGDDSRTGPHEVEGVEVVLHLHVLSIGLLDGLGQLRDGRGQRGEVGDGSHVERWCWHWGGGF
eukprot:scaffold18111_cov46-Phaeocystis_antarctica.AAC.2